MDFIDGPGLTDAPVSTTIFARALRLHGYFVTTEEERDALLRALRVPGAAEPGTTVYTGPHSLPYWAAAPASVRVVAMPGETELPQAARLDSEIAAALHRAGLTLGEAKALAEKPPTERHKHYEAYKAVSIAASWASVPATPLSEVVQRLEYMGESNTRRGAQAHDYSVTLVTDWPAYHRLAEELNRAAATEAVVGLDVETDVEDDYEAILVGVGFAFGAAKVDNDLRGQPDHGATAYYLPLNGPLGDGPARSLLELYFQERTPPRFIAHNGKFDMQVLAKYLSLPNSPVPLLRRIGSRLAGDGVLALYCLAHVDGLTGRPLPKALKWVTHERFGVPTLTFTEMLGLSGATKASEAPLGDIGPYCAADAYWGVVVCNDATRQLERYPKLLALYEKLELPMSPILAEMETLGLPLDAALLERRRVQSTERVEVYRRYLEQQAAEAGHQLKIEQKMCGSWAEGSETLPVGKRKWTYRHSRKKVDYENCHYCDNRGRVSVSLPFNPGSEPQVEAVLQGAFRLPRFGYTDGGAASNDEPALLRLREFTSDEDARDWITFFLAWRKEDKVRGTYHEGLTERKRLETWQRGKDAYYVHPRYNQDIVESGRLSSSDPNAQNIPLNQRDLFSAEVV